MAYERVHDRREGIERESGQWEEKEKPGGGGRSGAGALADTARKALFLGD